MREGEAAGSLIEQFLKSGSFFIGVDEIDVIACLEHPEAFDDVIVMQKFENGSCVKE